MRFYVFLKSCDPICFLSVPLPHTYANEASWIFHLVYFIAGLGTTVLHKNAISGCPGVFVLWSMRINPKRVACSPCAYCYGLVICKLEHIATITSPSLTLIDHHPVGVY
jgi:hypothetical protein